MLTLNCTLRRLALLIAGLDPTFYKQDLIERVIEWAGWLARLCVLALVMLVASVRYIDPKGKLKQTQELPPGKKDVVRALQRVSFNKDDLNRYKSLGIIGENNEGGVTLLEPEKIQPDDRAFVENLIKEENEDRLAIMSRIVETNETLTPSELPRVHKMFAALNRDKALKGERIQLDNGTWTQKDATP